LPSTPIKRDALREATDRAWEESRKFEIEAYRHRVLVLDHYDQAGLLHQLNFHKFVLGDDYPAITEMTLYEYETDVLPKVNAGILRRWGKQHDT